MRIKLTESKKLEFNMDTVGCSWEDLKGHLRFTFENVEYGFPADIKDGKVTVNVPPFQSIISESLNESISKNKEVVVRGRLDVIANEDSYVMPWSGDVEIEVPVAVRVKSNKDLQDMLEAAKGINSKFVKEKDVKVTDPNITTVSTAEKNPEPFDIVLKTADKQAKSKIKEVERKDKRKKMSKFASAIMGGDGIDGFIR